MRRTDRRRRRAQLIDCQPGTSLLVLGGGSVGLSAVMAQEGRFPYDRLITALPFTGINDAIAAQSRGEAVKVVLVHG